MGGRSIGAAGRRMGRPAATASILIAMLALGVSSAVAADPSTAEKPPVSAAQEDGSTQPKPEPTEPAPAEPLPEDPPSADADAPPTLEEPAEGPPAQGDAPATDFAPPPDENADPPADSGSEKPPQTDDAVAVAHNESIVLQAIWQVQEGCQTYCYGTSQTQSAVQGSDTTQSATATATEGGAVALNESTTVQFVWQMQLGCVAFCYDTSQTQSASQSAETTQEAAAIGDLLAAALNVAATIQYVWQFQQVCQVECYDVLALQSLSQEQATSQSATATAGTGYEDYGESLSWLAALAENLGATLQVIVQHQVASCLHHCAGDTQLQEALQLAATLQEAAAIAGGAAESAEGPAASEQSAEPAPELPPPGAAESMAMPGTAAPAAQPFGQVPFARAHARAFRSRPMAGRRGDRPRAPREAMFAETTTARLELSRVSSTGRTISAVGTSFESAGSRPSRTFDEPKAMGSGGDPGIWRGNAWPALALVLLAALVWVRRGRGGRAR